MAGEPGVKWMESWEAKEIDFARRSFPSKRMGQVGTIRKEWIRGMSLKIKLSGGVW